MAWYETHLVEGPLPLWSQIADRLRDDIRNGTFKPGDLLPGETEINQRFGVSRSTSRAALDHLKTEGLIKRRSGQGSIVIEPRVDRSLGRLSSFSEDMRLRGLTPGYRTRSIRRVAADPVVAAELKLKPGAEVLAIDRVMLADGRPIATALTWLRPQVFANAAPPTTADLDHGSLYAWLRQSGVMLSGGSERIEAALADPATARILQVKPPVAVIICHRTAWLAGGQPVEYVILHYLADRYSLHVKLMAALPQSDRFTDANGAVRRLVKAQKTGKTKEGSRM
jgi:GntR family transcriptional regulator